MPRKILHFNYVLKEWMIITGTYPSKIRALSPQGLLKSLPNNITVSLHDFPALKCYHFFSPCHLQWFHSCLHLINSLHHNHGELLKYKLVVITFLLTGYQRIPVALECNIKCFSQSWGLYKPWHLLTTLPSFHITHPHVHWPLFLDFKHKTSFAWSFDLVLTWLSLY